MVAELAKGARLVKSISNMPMAWIQDFSSRKKTVIFGDLIDSVGFVGIDLGSLAEGGAMQQLGAPLSGLDLHFVRRFR
jgi:8-hydroxy-5-deazaflavin:NADPH oxidoreductase